MERKPSEVIEEFIALCEKSHEEYSVSESMAKGIDGKTYTHTHELEDCEDENLFEFSKGWRQELRDRRTQKDNMEMWKKLHEFSINESNKPTLKRLKALLAAQKETEKYLEIPPKEREFKKGAVGK